MSELMLLRHAEPLTAGLYIGRGSDPPLSEKGRLDAERIAGILSAAPEVPEIVYSSQLARAVETARPLLHALGLPPRTSSGLAELDFGEWEGLGWEDIQQSDGELWKAWLDNPWKVAPPGGETLADLEKRVVGAVETIIKAYPGRRILLVCHGGPLRVVLGHALDLDPTAWWSVSIDYGNLSRFSHRGGKRLSLMQWNIPVTHPPISDESV